MFLQESPFLQEQPLEVFCKKKMFLKISQILQDLQASNFIKKRLQTQVFFCELRTTASVFIPFSISSFI